MSESYSDQLLKEILSGAKSKARKELRQEINALKTENKKLKQAEKEIRKKLEKEYEKRRLKLEKQYPCDETRIRKSVVKKLAERERQIKHAEEAINKAVGKLSKLETMSLREVIKIWPSLSPDVWSYSAKHEQALSIRDVKKRITKGK
jgi:seryl-tRNA synthetase